jgi:hypothetical protein
MAIINIKKIQTKILKKHGLTGPTGREYFLALI